MTGQTVREFYLAVQHTRLFKYDDIYAGKIFIFFLFCILLILSVIWNTTFLGILAYFLGIPAQNHPEFSIDMFSKFIDQNIVWKTKIVAHGFSPNKLREMYKEFSNIIL